MFPRKKVHPEFPNVDPKFQNVDPNVDPGFQNVDPEFPNVDPIVGAKCRSKKKMWEQNVGAFFLCSPAAGDLGGYWQSKTKKKREKPARPV